MKTKNKLKFLKMFFVLGFVFILYTVMLFPSNVFAASQTDISKGKNTGWDEYQSLRWASSPTWSYTSMKTLENNGTPYLDVKATNRYAYASCDFSLSTRAKDSNGNYTKYSKYTEAFYYQSLGGTRESTFSENPFAATRQKYGSRLLWLNYITLTDRKTYTFTPVVANEGDDVKSVYIYPEYFDNGGYFSGEIPNWISPSESTSITTNQLITTPGVNASKTRRAKNVVFLLRFATGNTSVGTGDVPIGFDPDIAKRKGINLNEYDYVYICYAPHTYSFNLNGGKTSSGASNLSNVSRYGVNNVQKTMKNYQNSISKEGYTFAGWKVTSGNTGTVIAADDLVSFSENKIETSAGTAKSISEYLGSSKFSNQLFTNCTFTAQWACNTANIDYRTSGGTVSGKGYTSNSEGVILKDGSPCFDKATYGYDYTTKTADELGLKKTGYTLTGWKVHSTGTVLGVGKPYGSTNYACWNDKNKTTKTATGFNSVLFAQWTPNTYSVKYNANGGTGSMSDSTATYNTNFITKKNSFTKTGYTFNGWNEKPDGTGQKWNLTSSGVYESGKPWKWTYAKNITLYAQWVPNQYKITLDDNGGTNPDYTKEVKVNYDDELPNITIPKRQFTVNFDTLGGSKISPIQTNSKFQGYYDINNVKYYDATGKGIRIWNKAKNDTLYASWEDEAITLPDCDKDGFIIKGWTDGSNEYKVGDKYTPTKNVTLTAIYNAEIKVYDVDVYKFNGGEDGILGSHTIIGNIGTMYKCSITNPKEKSYEKENCTYKYLTSTTLTPTLNKGDNVIYRFYNPVMELNANVYNMTGNKFFNKNEYGYIVTEVTGYANNIEFDFPDVFKGTKWKNAVTGNTVSLENDTTISLDIKNPSLSGGLNFIFKMPNKDLDNEDLTIKVVARRNNPSDFFMNWKSTLSDELQNSLNTALELEVEVDINIIPNNIDIRSMLRSSVRSLPFSKK